MGHDHTAVADETFAQLRDFGPGLQGCLRERVSTFNKPRLRLGQVHVVQGRGAGHIAAPHGQSGDPATKQRPEERSRTARTARSQRRAKCWWGCTCAGRPQRGRACSAQAALSEAGRPEAGAPVRATHSISRPMSVDALLFSMTLLSALMAATATATLPLPSTREKTSTTAVGERQTLPSHASCSRVSQAPPSHTFVGVVRHSGGALSV